MNVNYVITLAHNLTSETDKTTAMLHWQNDDLTHLIFDLGFPLLEGDKIPDDIQEAKNINSIRLQEMCQEYGSSYHQIPNLGVSQNWSRAIEIINPDDSDIICGADPDERTLNDNWVEAMGTVMRKENIALCSLKQTGCPEIDPQYYDEHMIDGIRTHVMKGLTNWALIGMKGEFLNKIGRVIPFPPENKRYGYIEHLLSPKFFEHGYNWAILPDFGVTHTDDVPLYRAWKDEIIFRRNNYSEQISFEEFLVLKRENKI